MFNAMYLVVTTGLVVGVAALVVALAKGRAGPQRRVPWIVALVVLGIDAALHVAASVGLTVASLTGEAAMMDGAWLLMGTVAFLAILAAAILRPRLAGWLLLASAAVVPLVFALGDLGVQLDGGGAPPWPVVLVTYSVPAAVAGGLLVLSTVLRREVAGDRAPAARQEVGAGSA